MSFLKKTITQITTTGTTTGCTENEYVIIPDLNVEYHMKIMLKQDAVDLGFFDVEPFLETDRDLITIKKGIGFFNIVTNISWRIVNDSDWIYVDEYVGVNDRKINVIASKNGSDNSRSTTLKIISNGLFDEGNELINEVMVIQDGDS